MTVTTVGIDIAASATLDSSLLQPSVQGIRKMRITKKITILIACALLSAGAAVAQQTAQQTIGSLEPVVKAGTASRAQQLDLARAYIQTGRFYEASTLTKSILDLDPNDLEATSVRDEAVKGLRAAAQDKLTAAQSNAQRQGATDEDRLALADAYFSAGDYRAAASLYAKLPRSVMNRDARLRQARALAWSSQLDQSERVYADLIKEQDTPELELEYGRLLSWMGATSSATETLKSVYEQSRTEDAAVALANAQAWSGHREEAIKLLTDYTASNPGSIKAKQLLRDLETSPDLAIEKVDRLIDANQFDLALRVQRARLLYDAGRYYEAMKTIDFVRNNTHQKIEGLDELYKQASERRQQELARLDERRKNLDTTDSGMTSSSGSGDDLLDLAKAYTALGGYDQSIALYERYLRNHPDDLQARLNYARVLSWDRRYTLAERQYDQLLREMPDRADIRYEYAQTLSYNSDYVDAIHTLNQLTDVSDNPRARLYRDVPQKAYFSLGQIYRWYGWNDTAVENQNRALSLDSSYSPARQELALAQYRRPTTSLGATYGFAEDSTGFQFHRLDFDGQKWISPRTAVEGSIGRHEFSRNTSDIFSIAASAGLRYRLQDRMTVRGRVGANFYDSGLGTRPFWNAGVDWLPNIQTRTAFDYNHYDLVYDVFNLGALTPVSPVPTSLGHPLDIDDFRGQAIWNSGGFWSLQGDGSYGFVSDRNKRAAAHGLVGFRLFKEPFVAVKAEGRWLSYNFRTNRYWSPTDYRSLAGVLQIGQNRKKYFWTVEGKLGKGWEGSDIPGVGTRSSDLRSIIGTVTVPVSDLFDVVGSYGYGKSGRFDDVFGNGGTNFRNYWQRNWYVGIRLNRIFNRGDQAQNHYYYDNSVLSGSPVLPPVGETH